MTNYQELKRLAEAAKLELADIANVVIEDGDLSHHELFQSLASPDVVLGLIKSLEHTTMAAEAEAKEVDERNAVIAGLRTQNQALMEALERMVESVTGVDQVSAVDEARAALTAAKQAQPERAPLEADMFWDHEDPETFGHDIETIASNYGLGDEIEIDCAKRMPGIKVRVIQSEPEGELTWERIDFQGAAHGIKQGGQHD